MYRETLIQNALSFAQAGLGCLVLLAICGGTLAHGAVQPLGFTLMALLVATAFALQVPLDALRGVPRAVHRASLVLALPWVAVMLWLWVQTLPGMPVAWAHPGWAFAPDGAARAMSADPPQGRLIVMRLICYGLIFFLVARCALDRRHAMLLLRLFALFSTALAAYGLQAALRDGGPVTGPFVNRNSCATMAAFGALANLAMLRHVMAGRAGPDLRISLRHILDRMVGGGWIHAMGALLCLSALALTASRAGGLAGQVGIMVFLGAVSRNRRGEGRLAWVPPLLIIGFVLTAMTSDVAGRLGDMTGDARFRIYPAVLDGITERPLPGHGVGSFRDTFRRHVPAELGHDDWDMAHSSYLENAYEFGLPAAAVFYAVLALIGWRLLAGVRRRRTGPVIPAFALACFTVAALHSAVDFSLQIPSIAASFAAILGIGWAQSFSRADYRGPDRHRASARSGANAAYPAPTSIMRTPSSSRTAMRRPE